MSHNNHKNGAGGVQQIEWPSVEEAKPDEEGGSEARAGFNYQDEIAVSFLLDMLEDPAIEKIHCETHDDILVVRVLDDTDERYVEYVQVKGGQPDKLWSVADLCQRNNKKPGTSIFEKSLSRDRHKEHSLFRIVTLRSIVSDLKVLAIFRGAIGRESDCEAMRALKADLDERFPGITSAKGNSASFWLEHCYWDVRHEENSVKNSNLVRLIGLSKVHGTQLLIEPAEVLLDELRAKAKIAGAAKWIPDRHKKVFSRVDLQEWWVNRLRELTQADGLASGGRLVEKLEAADLPDDVTKLAINLRQRYSAEVRSPRYLEAIDVDPLLDRVKSEIATLRSRFVSGEFEGDGAAFHALCLKQMDWLNTQRPQGTPDQSAFLKGCLYDITDRCLLRFERPTQ